MAEVVQIAKPDAGGASGAPAPGGFIMTATAKDMLRSLALVHEGEGARFTLIAGAPGVGKTKAVERFAECESKVEAVRFKREAGKASDVSDVLFRAFIVGERCNGKSMTERCEMLCKHAPNYVRTILADEAQHLTADGIEWFRGFAEEAGVSVAFIGDLKLAELVQPIPQLASRIIRPVVLKKVSARDVQALAATWPLFLPDVPAILRALEAVAAKDRRLRNVENVLHLAGLFAGAGPITAEHVRAAIVDLKLDRRMVQ